MNTYILFALLFVCVVGALFTTLIVVSVAARFHQIEERQGDIERQMQEIQQRLENIEQFDSNTAEAINQVIDVVQDINERTGWLIGLDEQIDSAFNKKKTK